MPDRNLPAHRRTFSETPWAFFLATFLWSWGFWWVFLEFQLTVSSLLGFVLWLSGGFGPLVMGVGFTALTQSPAGQRDYWQRAFDPRRIGWRWLGVVVLFVPALNGLAAGIDWLFGGPGVVLGSAARNLQTHPFGFGLAVLFTTLVPWIEELGWRGYSLDRLQAHRSALSSALILGAIWSLWHLPLAWMPGTYQQGLGIGTDDFWLFFLGIIPLSVIFSWVYNNTNRSTLAVVLLHAMVNFTGELFGISPRADRLTILLWAIAAIGAVTIWGPRTLTKGRPYPPIPNN